VESAEASDPPDLRACDNEVKGQLIAMIPNPRDAITQHRSTSIEVRRIDRQHDPQQGMFYAASAPHTDRKGGGASVAVIVLAAVRAIGNATNAVDPAVGFALVPFPIAGRVTGGHRVGRPHRQHRMPGVAYLVVKQRGSDSRIWRGTSRVSANSRSNQSRCIST
jgi:hypothetical protein